MKKYRVVLTILFFIAAMTVGRLFWLELFEPSGQPFAADGLLDLRNWDAESGQTITLDGEWEFYPGILTMSEGQERDFAKYRAQRLDIPSKWNAHLQTDTPSPYGFATYRLTIVVGSADEVYSIYVPSIRSSSQLYVNGKLIASSGRPASSAEEYEARNVPYIATFMANKERTIELVIQAANFADPRSGGLVRSLKFGTDEAIFREKQLSMATQQLIAAALMMQAVYLLLFFAIERNKLWFYLAVSIMSFTIITLNSSEDKLLLHWFPISYAWSYKLLCLSLTVLAYAILQMVSIQLSESWRVKWLRIYGVAAFVGVVMSIWLPPQSSEIMQYAIFLTASPILVLLIVSVLRMAVRGIRSSLMQFLAFLAFANHMVWWTIYMFMGIKVIFYPFDLILGMILFSSIWIKRYFEMYTEQKQLTEKLEEVDKKKDMFLANTSHELRNPLHGMINISQSVLERERDAISGTSIRELETVLNVGRRMSFMLDDLLDVARLKDSSLRLNIQSALVQPIVSGVMDMIRFMAIGKPIELINRVPEQFPKVLADENRLIQILFNLLHNAVKYTHEGEVCVEAYTEKGKAFIVVSDTGIGMDEETVRRVFEPYEQADPMNGYEGGFGLGLSISKQLVELHGGTITARSVPTKGSRFVFTLKLDDRSESQVIQEKGTDGSLDFVQSLAVAAALPVPDDRKEDEPDPLQRYVGDKPRILVVDDDALNLSILVSILSRDDYKAATVMNGAEALALLNDQEWDLIITDIMMPSMSGYELTRKIRERYTVSELPVLLLTARNRPEDIENGFFAGANDYVTKPVEARELRARVQALTHLKRSARQRIRMEAAWLKAQIEPHFFLNTLNSIASLHTDNPERMIELIEHFGDFLREKFKFQNIGERVPLNDELTLVRSYLFIEQARYGDRLQVEWEINGNTEDLHIPPYSIQPLVENAIRHGLMKRAEGGIVRIRLSKLDVGAEISVIDNGIGMSDEVVAGLLEPAADRKGIALRNVDFRLKRLYGRGLNIASAPGAGTTVSFVIR